MIKYNTPIPVTNKQANQLAKDLPGIIAYTCINGYWYVKVLLMQYHKLIKFVFRKRGVQF